MLQVSALASFTLLLSAIYYCQASSEKPNIIIIVADDLGYNDVGFHGGDVRTPNIDALAGHGIILNRHYALPMCSPSRAALMTAKYPIRTGMEGMPIEPGQANGLPLNEKIFPQYFKKLGYKTHVIGKWHLGFETWNHLPTKRGFDTFYGYLNGFLGYYDGIHSHQGHRGLDFRRNEAPIWNEIFGHYLTDLLTKEAVSRIEQHEEKEALLLILNHAAAHKGNLDLFRDSPPDTTNFTGRAVLADIVRWMDDSIGQIVVTLEKKNLLNNSIIVFLSDNGAPTVDYLINYLNYGSNWPLRGVKLSSHDGGIRTTALIWSPLLSHRISTDLFHITDWLPTLYTAAGGHTGDLENIDGLSHWHSFIGNSRGPRMDALLNIDPFWNNEAYIQGKWKLIRNHYPTAIAAYSDKYYGVSGRDTPYDPLDVENSLAGKILGKPSVPYDKVRIEATLNETCDNKVSAEATDCHSKYCLYDIQADPTECRDLSAHYPQVVAELEFMLKRYRAAMVPNPNRTYNERANPENWNGYWNPWMETARPLNSGTDWTESSLIFLLTLTVHFVWYSLVNV